MEAGTTNLPRIGSILVAIVIGCIHCANGAEPEDDVAANALRALRRENSMPILAKLKKLRYVSLAGTRVTDVGLKKLVENRSLEFCNVADTMVSGQLVAALQEELRLLMIIHR